MQNHFVRPPEEYSRDLNVMKHYVEDAAYYLHKRTGKPLEQCKAFVGRETNTGGSMAIVDPDTLCLTRPNFDAKYKEVIPFTDYLKDIIDNDRIIAPTLTVYTNQSQKTSLLSEFIAINIAKRKKSKAEKFAAQQAGDAFLTAYKDNEQQSFKVSNNSLSGAHASQGTILHNKSSHSSLTSTCRTATSYGNGNNEKFLMGNRHYWSSEITKSNIISIIRHVDYTAIEASMQAYGIRHPTVEETMAVINYSTALYWTNQGDTDSIELLIRGLTDLERSAFVYVGDLYHLAMYNPEVVRKFLTTLSAKATVPVSNPDDYLGILDDDLGAFVNLLCSDELRGTGLRALKKDNYEAYCIVGATAKIITESLFHYKDLVIAFWRTDSIPASVANIRSSVRRAVVTSDTDSTIFTTQYWTKWFVGKLDFSETSNNISYAITYLSTQTIIHILATVSTGFGVHKDHLHTLAMKNEFAFPTFSLTTMAKHYYAYISAQEGNVRKELEMEVKGVQLKDSNVPKHIMAEFNNTLEFVMGTAMNGEQLSIVELKNKIADIEMDIQNSVIQGSSEYLKNGQIKEKAAYQKPMSSAYAQYLMWNEVFGPKYGETPPPPYATIKVSVDFSSKTKLNAWLDSLDDQELADRFKKYMSDYNKISVSNFLLPKLYVQSNGIPKEILTGMDMRKLIYTTVKPYYLLLESLGIYMINKDLTRLVSDDVLEGNNERLING